MLEGLEVVEVNFSQCKNVIDFRIDSNTYLKEFLQTEQVLSAKPTLSIEEVSVSVQNFGAYSLCNYINFVEEGIRFLMAQNIRENYIDWNASEFIDEKSHEMLWKSHCHKGQVLITMAGYVGRAAVYDKDEVISSNQAIAKITLKNPENAFLTSTFLNSKHGQNQIHRLQTATAQPNINMSLIKALKIPVFSVIFSCHISSLLLNSNNYKNDSDITYKKAEQTLLEAMGLADFKPSTQNTNIKTFAQSFGASGRLDAEHYQSKYDYLEKMFNQFERIKLQDLVNYPISSGITPKAGGDDYTDAENGVPFVRAVDLQNGLVSIDNFNYIKPEIHTGILKRTQLKQNDFLFSIAGTVGRCAIFEHAFEANINQAVAILRFNDERVNPYYLMIFFNSYIGKEFVEKYSRQGLQTNLNLAEVGDLSIPIIDLATQDKISQLVQQSFSLKAESERLLNLAKRAVEIAIEQDEVAAMDYLQ